MSSRCASVLSSGRLALSCALLLFGCAATPQGRGSAKPIEVDGVWHVVKQGETLQGLARQYGAALDDLEELNGVDRRDRLVLGSRLFIPGGRQGKASRASPSPSRAASRAFIWPVPGGKLSSPFGKRAGRMHEGIDIAAAEGAPIVAAAAGRVLYAGSGIKGYGNLVMLRHANDIVTIYAHNRRNHVREGQKVRQGEVIAEVGRTGRATGFHLHFEVRRGERVQDPMPYLKADGGKRAGGP